MFELEIRGEEWVNKPKIELEARTSSRVNNQPNKIINMHTNLSSRDGTSLSLGSLTQLFRNVSYEIFEGY